MVGVTKGAPDGKLVFYHLAVMLKCLVKMYFQKKKYLLHYQNLLLAIKLFIKDLQLLQQDRLRIFYLQ